MSKLKRYRLTDEAQKIATEAHHGINRSDGKPYITHPQAISKAVKKYVATYQKELWGDVDSSQYDKVVAWFEATAWLHDVIEDHYEDDMEAGYEYLRTCGIPKRVRNALVLLTHIDNTLESKNGSYISYILDIYHSGNPIAIAVKLCDLQHNMQDLKASPRLDKYKCAYFLLQQAWAEVLNEGIEV